MGDATVKPSDGDDLVLSNNDGTSKLELNEDQTVKVTTGSDAGEDFLVNTDKLVVEGDTGQVGIGTTTPTTEASANTFLEIDGGGNRAGLALNGFNSSSRWEIVADEGDDLFFARGGGQVAIMTAQGHVEINDGNLVIGTAGHGIDFSNQTSASGVSGVSVGNEILNHYEEGTWTIGNTTASAFSTNTAYYTKIGDAVFCSGYFVVASGKTTGTGFSGLPFLIRGNAGAAAGGQASYQSQNTGEVMSCYGSAGTFTFMFVLGNAAQIFEAGTSCYFNLNFFTDS